MKQFLRQLFSLILTPLESGTEPYAYKPSHRKILIVVSCLFIFLATTVFVMAQGQDAGYYFPVIIFGVVGFTGLVVGICGEDRAVAKLWGSTK